MPAETSHRFCAPFESVVRSSAKNLLPTCVSITDTPVASYSNRRLSPCACNADGSRMPAEISTVRSQHCSCRLSPPPLPKRRSMRRMSGARTCSVRSRRHCGCEEAPEAPPL
eukprot:6190893-Pleurochrysis_carterae.AAC.1